MIRTYNEGNTVTVSARFTAADGTTLTPGSVRYRVDCESTNRVLLDWQPAVPAEAIAIPIPGALNVLIDQSRDYERKVVTVEADYDTNLPYIDVIKYDVLNLQGIKQ